MDQSTNLTNLSFWGMRYSQNINLIKRSRKCWGKLKSRAQICFSSLRSQKIHDYITGLGLSFSLWYIVVAGHYVVSRAPLWQKTAPHASCADRKWLHVSARHSRHWTIELIKCFQVSWVSTTHWVHRRPSRRWMGFRLEWSG